MGKNIAELTATLKKRKVNGELAYLISLLVRWDQQEKMLIDWINENPQAGEREISLKAEDLQRKKLEELRAQRQTERQIP